VFLGGDGINQKKLIAFLANATSLCSGEVWLPDEQALSSGISVSPQEQGAKKRRGAARFSVCIRSFLPRPVFSLFFLVLSIWAPGAPRGEKNAKTEYPRTLETRATGPASPAVPASPACSLWHFGPPWGATQALPFDSHISTCACGCAVYLLLPLYSLCFMFYMYSLYTSISISVSLYMINNI
jgi:hypothetical protein